MSGTGGSGAAVVKVVGIGGAGGNIVSSLLPKGIAGVEFAVMNMDKTAVRYSPCPNKVHFEVDGRGEGQPLLGRLAAMENRDTIEAILQGAHMVILTAGMGGCCGTGATPVVAQIAKEMGALVACVVTAPFCFEGQKRMAKAREGIDHLLQVADSLLVHPNERLVKIFGKKRSLQRCFDASNDALLCGIRCLAGLAGEDALIPLDFEDVQKMLEGSGCLHFASVRYKEGVSAGKAAEKMMEGPFQNADFLGAKKAILSFDMASETGLEDLNTAFALIQRAFHQDAQILLRARLDPSLGDMARITVLAAGSEPVSGNRPVFQILDLGGL